MVTYRHPGTWPASASGGFVLLEVLVALTLFAVGIVGVLTAVLASMNLQKELALRYQAGLLLQDLLAETRLSPYDGEPIQGQSRDGRYRWTIASEPWSAADSGVGQRVADSQPADASNRLVEVVVQVSWPARRGLCQVCASQLVRLAAAAGSGP